MSTAAKFLEIAQAEIGTVEGPKDNQTKYGAFTGHNYQPWCGSFCMWVAHKSNVKIPNVVYTPAGVEAFKGTGAWSNAETAKPKPGDIVFFDFVEGGAPVEHVGIVLKDNGDGTITTIEGNTAGDKKKSKSEANGGEVALKTRAYKAKNKRGLLPFVVGFGRPAFKAEPKEIK
jgi:hypothetical protein